MTAEVRVAGFADLDALTAYRLWALRSAVFVVEQDCPYLDLDGRDLEPLTLHLWVEQDGQPVATLRLLDDGDALRIGRVATAAPSRGRGLAALLVRAALERQASGRWCSTPSRTWWTGMPRSASLPAGLGSVDDGIPHTPMRRPGHDS